MAAVGLTQFQKSNQTQTQIVLLPRSSPDVPTMWNDKKQAREDEEDDSWEVRAFEEDTLGCTWPPRCYTCTFCRREFRSAQALGGHMNVHRRDRARLHEAPLPVLPEAPLLIPSQEFVANNGLCLVYSFANPNGMLVPAAATMDAKSLRILPGLTHDKSSSTTDFPLAVARSVGPSPCQYSSYTEPSATQSNENVADLAVEELDLELRLGRRSTPQP